MRLGRIAGIKLRIHPLLLLLIGFYIWLGLGQEVLYIICAVLIHELAHTFTAVRMRIEVEEIELLPFGGQARLKGLSGLEPEGEIYVALAGPFTSLFLAALFYFFPLLSEGESTTSFFVHINLLLGLFNLLPVLPLDGGRILRAVLSRVQGYRQATSTAAGLGKLVAVLLMVSGIYLIRFEIQSANLLVVGVFLFWAARREASLLSFAFMRFLVKKKGELSRHGFLPCYQVVSRPETPIKDILKSARPAQYLLVVVIDSQDRIQATAGEAELIECLLEKGPSASLNDL
jgi:stage IV sporulation protein FB